MRFTIFGWNVYLDDRVTIGEGTDWEAEYYSLVEVSK